METTKRFGRRPAGLALAGLMGLAAALVVVGGGCVKPTSLSVPMTFRPKESLNLNAVSGRLPATAKVYIAPVEDKRTDKKDLIGENLEGGTPIPVYSADKPPKDFVRDVLQQDLQAAGVQIAEGPETANRIVDVELTKFLVQENPGYQAEVRANVKVSDVAGHPLFSGPFGGSSTGFGRSLSAENYQEQMSTAVRSLTNGMLNNPAFLQALGGPGGSSSAEK